MERDKFTMKLSSGFLESNEVSPFSQSDQSFEILLPSGLTNEMKADMVASFRKETETMLAKIKKSQEQAGEVERNIATRKICFNQLQRRITLIAKMDEKLFEQFNKDFISLKQPHYQVNSVISMCIVNKIIESISENNMLMNHNTILDAGFNIVNFFGEYSFFLKQIVSNIKDMDMLTLAIFRSCNGNKLNSFIENYIGVHSKLNEIVSTANMLSNNTHLFSKQIIEVIKKKQTESKKLSKLFGISKIMNLIEENEMNDVDMDRTITSTLESYDVSKKAEGYIKKQINMINQIILTESRMNEINDYYTFFLELKGIADIYNYIASKEVGNKALLQQIQTISYNDGIDIKKKLTSIKSLLSDDNWKSPIIMREKEEATTNKAIVFSENFNKLFNLHFEVFLDVFSQDLQDLYVIIEGKYPALLLIFEQKIEFYNFFKKRGILWDTEAKLALVTHKYNYRDVSSVFLNKNNMLDKFIREKELFTELHINEILRQGMLILALRTNDSKKLVFDELMFLRDIITGHHENVKIKEFLSEMKIDMFCSFFTLLYGYNKKNKKIEEFETENEIMKKFVLEMEFDLSSFFAEKFKWDHEQQQKIMQQQKIAEAKKQLDIEILKIKTEEKNLQEKYNNLQKDFEMLQKNLEKTKQDNDELQVENAEIENTIKELEIQNVEEFNKYNNDINSTNNDIAKINKDYDELQQQYTQLSQKSKDDEKNEVQKIEQYKKKIEEYKKLSRDEEEKLSAIEKERLIKIEDLEQYLALLSTSNMQLNQENNNISINIQNEKENFQVLQEQNVSLLNEQKSYMEKIQDQIKEMQKYQELRKTPLPSDKTVSVNQKKLEELRREIFDVIEEEKRLESDYGLLSEQIEEKQKFQKQIKWFQKQLEQLLEEKAEYQRDVGQLNYTLIENSKCLFKKIKSNFQELKTSGPSIFNMNIYLLNKAIENLKNNLLPVMMPPCDSGEFIKEKSPEIKKSQSTCDLNPLSAETENIKTEKEANVPVDNGTNNVVQTSNDLKFNSSVVQKYKVITKKKLQQNKANTEAKNIKKEEEINMFLDNYIKEIPQTDDDFKFNSSVAQKYEVVAKSPHRIEDTTDTSQFTTMSDTEDELCFSKNKYDFLEQEHKVLKEKYDLLKDEHEKLRKICLAREKENLELKKK